MSTEIDATPTVAAAATPEMEMPSAEWVRAVSDLLDTDPADLLAELGYYDRSNEDAAAQNNP